MSSPRFNTLKYKMGAYLSSAEPVPDLPSDVIQSIIEKTSTSTILDSALYVSPKWHEIGRRNVIWIPRYKQLTGVTLNPTDFHQYQVFPLFLKEWTRRTAVHVDEVGNVVRVPDNVTWIDSVDEDHQYSDLIGTVFTIGDWDQEFHPIPGIIRIPHPPLKVLTTRNLRRPELYRVFREFGKPLRLERLDFYTITPGNDLLEMQILGKGTYNCAVLLDNGNVLRIASLENAHPWTLRSIPRGAAITHLFSQYRKMLGPSALKEKGKGRMVRVLPTEFSEHVCDTIKDSKGPFYLQEIEHLDGGLLPQDDDFVQHAFPLVWFLYVAHNHFAFRHGDLKVGNIVFRTYPSPKRMTFRTRGTSWSYKFRAVPVIIDYDFASLYVTERPEDRISDGTYVCIPPEALLEIYNEVEPHNRTYYDDWWALGMVLFTWWARVSVNNVFPEQRTEYYNLFAWNENNFYTLKHAFNAFIIVRSLYELEGVMPYPPTDSPFYSDKALALLANLPRLKIPVAWTFFQLGILRQLLSWDPNERGKDLLKRHFQESLGHIPDYEYDDQPLNIKMFRTKALKARMDTCTALFP